MSKKTIITLNVIVMAVWMITIIINLLSGDISKFSYGACGFTLLLSWFYKTLTDVRVFNLYDENTKLRHERFEMLKRLLMKEEKQ